MSWAAQIEQGDPSHPVGEEVEEGDEASFMDISGSMGRPPHRQCTPRPRGRERHHQGMEVDELIVNMGVDTS